MNFIFSSIYCTCSNGSSSSTINSIASIWWISYYNSSTSSSASRTSRVSSFISSSSSSSSISCSRCRLISSSGIWSIIQVLRGSYSSTSKYLRASPKTSMKSSSSRRLKKYWTKICRGSTNVSIKCWHNTISSRSSSSSSSMSTSSI